MGRAWKGRGMLVPPSRFSLVPPAGRLDPPRILRYRDQPWQSVTRIAATSGKM